MSVDIQMEKDQVIALLEDNLREKLRYVAIASDSMIVKNIKSISVKQDAVKDMFLFVGYEDNIPVATSCLFLTDAAGIYDIATRPDKRNLGFGTAMFYHALQEAKKRGFAQAVLQASSDGLNIYKRFGFEEVCHFDVWSYKR